jgi:hypothetical protein
LDLPLCRFELSRLASLSVSFVESHWVFGGARDCGGGLGCFSTEGWQAPDPTLPMATALASVQAGFPFDVFVSSGSGYLGWRHSSTKQL